MNRRDRLRLFSHVGGGLPILLLTVAVIGGAFHFSGAETEPSEKYSLMAYGVAGLALAVYYWRKSRRALDAATQGLRRDAEVTDIRLHARSDDGEDDYVLVWKDSDGYVGNSVPAVRSSFDGIEKGDRIVIYRNADPVDSWWERDVHGPVIRS